MLFDLDVGIGGGGAREQRLVLHRPVRTSVSDRDERLHLGERGANLIGDGREAGFEQHRSRAHGPHQRQDFRWREPIVQRNAHQPQLGQREIDLRQLGAIVAEKAHDVRLPQAEPEQGVGETVAPLVDLPETELPPRARAKDRLAISKTPRRGRDDVGGDEFTQGAGSARVRASRGVRIDH